MSLFPAFRSARSPRACKAAARLAHVSAPVSALLSSLLLLNCQAQGAQDSSGARDLEALRDSATAERARRIEASPQHEDGRFRNAVVKPQLEGSVFGMFRKLWFGKELRVPPKAFPVAARDSMAFTEPPAELKVTWLGHSTLLLEVEGKRLLIDPVFESHAAPLPVFARRFQAPPLARDSLPRLDGVVISHDHYDHLEKESVVALAERGLPFFVPLGVGGHLQRWGVDPAQIHELDWWEEARVGDLRLACTPAQHFSGRGVLDGRKTLWASWSFLGANRRVFYSGDGGYGPHFKKIGARLGPFDLTLIENGAYDLQWPHIHMFPEQAAQAHRDLGGRLLMPVHWGMFNLANHDWFEPIRRLEAAARDSGIALFTPRLGEPVSPLDSVGTGAWWAEALP